MVGAGFATLFLSACTQVPELDQAIPDWVRKADYPQLVALDASLISQVSPQEQSDKIANDLLARRDRLNRRAERLKDQ